MLDRVNNTALMLSSALGQTDIIKLLLENIEKSEKRIDVNIQNSSGYTALMISIKIRHPEIVRLFLKSSNKTNINVNIQNYSNKTALLYAFEKGYMEIVRLLLKHRKINIYEILNYDTIKEVLRRNVNYIYKLKQPKKEIKYYDKRY